MGILKDDEKAIQEVKGRLNDIGEKLLPTDFNDAKEYVEWLNTKTDMRLNPDIAKSFPIFKKGVYYIDFGKNIGSEQEKDRPAVILWGTKLSEVVVVAPISDEPKYVGSTFWFHVPLSTGDTVLVEQIRTVSKTRIRAPFWNKGKVRALLDDELKKINEALEHYKFDV